MYTPYLRNWKFETLALLKSLDTLRKSEIIPIIEPVTNNNLRKMLNAFKIYKQPIIFILNPRIGDLKGIALREMKKIIDDYPECIMGFIIDESSTTTEIKKIIQLSIGRTYALIHFAPALEIDSVVTLSNSTKDSVYHIFIESPSVNARYMAQFNDFRRIWIQNGFNRDKVKNADFEEVDFFSDLAFKYKEKKFFGFGDFQIVGDKRESPKGLARAVAIHLTHLEDRSGQRYVFCSHFVSNDTIGTENAGGKFLQALDKFSQHKDRFVDTLGIKEYSILKRKEHYPGLGKLKELSIIHHIEFMASLNV